MTNPAAHTGLGLEPACSTSTRPHAARRSSSPLAFVSGTWPDLSGEALDIAKIYAQVVGFLMWQSAL